MSEEILDCGLGLSVACIEELNVSFFSFVVGAAAKAREGGG